MTACLPATLILAAVLPCPPVLAAHAEDDSFSSPTLDSCRWFDWSRNGSSASGAGLQLQTSSTEIYSDGRVISQYMISGDISMEVSVAAGAGFEEPISPSAQMYAAFGLWADNSNFLFIAVARNIDQPVIRVLRRSSAGGFENFPDIPIASPAAYLTTLRQWGRTIFSEGSYPHSPTGMVLANAMAEFPFTAEGQASWVRELPRFGNNSPGVAGLHYFYPEWHSAMNPANPDSPVLSSGGLFDTSESPLPAMTEFGNGRSVVMADSDRLFNWAESTFPSLLSPCRPPSQSIGDYYLRYYGNTNAYLGTSVLDPGNVSDYLPGAASAGY